MSRWIRTADKLPPVGRNILIYSERNGVAEGVLKESKNDKTKKWSQFRWNAALGYNEVSYWRPMAKAPNDCTISFKFHLFKSVSSVLSLVGMVGIFLSFILISIEIISFFFENNNFPYFTFIIAVITELISLIIFMFFNAFSNFLYELENEI